MYTQLHIHVHLHTQLHVHISRACVYIHTYIHTITYTYTYIQIITYTYLYIHTALHIHIQRAKHIVFFCRIQSLSQVSFAKETYERETRLYIYIYSALRAFRGQGSRFCVQGLGFMVFGLTFRSKPFGVIESP